TLHDHGHALQILLEWLSEQDDSLELVGVGHRVVHGGRRFHAPVRVTAEVLEYLQTLTPLAPNHQPPCLLGITTLQHLLPRLPQVACFDTAFHHDRPEVEQHFALPSRPELDEVRRYGFHGLSYEYIASVLPDYLGARADGKIILAHLGHGASLCALHKRRSIATTMTFTPLDGLPMGTRSGSIDPAVVLYLLQRGMSAADISDLLYFQSGLLGVSGETSDMTTLLERSSAPAKRAIEQFVHHTVRGIGSLAAALGGLDALVFTAGIGEHATPIRAAISERCEWLGLHLDGVANQLGRACISHDDSPVQGWVIATDEESMIAEHSLRVLNHHEQRSTA
ncbi:MAG TPA: acetate/propionate family kinase, partial [Gammaproteobacteria bacterium]|nr:acetate/propionate family kinase [Gammaproteobacteria bacterium]